MKIAKAIFRQEAFGDQQNWAVQKSPSSKAAAIFARGASWHDVSTEKWRERRWRLFSTDPYLVGLVVSRHCTLYMASSKIFAKLNPFPLRMVSCGTGSRKATTP